MEEKSENKVILIGSGGKGQTFETAQLIAAAEAKGLEVMVIDTINQKTEDLIKQVAKIKEAYPTTPDAFENQPYVITRPKESFIYAGDEPIQKKKRGGNNRKVKKHKKAKNGRSKKKK
jgi:hypothetical protein